MTDQTTDADLARLIASAAGCKLADAFNALDALRQAGLQIYRNDEIERLSAENISRQTTLTLQVARALRELEERYDNCDCCLEDYWQASAEAAIGAVREHDRQRYLANRDGHEACEDDMK